MRNEEEKLFISFQKPHKIVIEDTLGKWIRSSLVTLEVDKKFTAHSTRHASTSKAYEKGMSIEEIKRSWLILKLKFTDFYNRLIIIQVDNFATKVLLLSD